MVVQGLAPCPVLVVSSIPRSFPIFGGSQIYLRHCSPRRSREARERRGGHLQAWLPFGGFSVVRNPVGWTPRSLPAVPCSITRAEILL